MPIATPAAPHPHLPIPLGDLSVWQKSTRDHPLLNRGKDEPLPSEADVVIVGSGMCGAVVANTLLNAENRPGRVVVLEAREICSGASGRNAGHCRPDAARGFDQFAALHGAEQAIKILSSESVVLDRVDAFVNEHSVECEWTPRDTYDVCLSEEFEKYESTSLANMRAAGGQPDIEVVGSEEAKKGARSDMAIAAFKWKAATLNPAKLTLGIHTINTSLGGYELFAYAPVHSVAQDADGVSWSVVTPRGSVKAGKVVFCTNAYSQAIVPVLEGLIIPTKAQAVKLSAAPAGLDACPRFDPSYSLRFLPKHFYSVATRPDNSIVLGTSRGWAGMPPAVLASTYNTVDDSCANPLVTQNGVETFAELYPKGGWSAEGIDEGRAKGYEYAWTGIIGMTPDAVPFIGDVPGKAGQYVAAGYNGHGMARIFLCAPTLAKYMLDGTWDTAMPEAFRVTPERIAGLRKTVDHLNLGSGPAGFSKLVA